MRCSAPAHGVGVGGGSVAGWGGGVGRGVGVGGGSVAGWGGGVGRGVGVGGGSVAGWGGGVGRGVACRLPRRGRCRRWRAPRDRL